MWHDFDSIPEPAGGRGGNGSMLARMYHDIGLAAVANALGLPTADLDGDLASSIERGEFYLLPIRSANIDLAA